MLWRFPKIMNLAVAVLLLIFVISNELRPSAASHAGRRRNKAGINVNKSVRADGFWMRKSRPSAGRFFVKNDISFPSKNNSSHSKDTGRQNPQRVPQINFYSSIPNALGVIGQGIIWLREISAALGTPIPIWIFTIPFFILGVGLMFMPDLTQLQLPLFYPDGAGDGDPLAAFPPIPDINNLANLNIVKAATQLLPPNFIMEKLG